MNSNSAGRVRPRNLVISAMLISSAMVAIEATVISTIMPVIISRIGGASLFSWAFSSYLITQAVVSPICGRLSDIYGRKRVYLVCAGAFAVGSALCGLAPNMPVLICWRIIQAIGGAGLTTLSTTIISDLTNRTNRSRYLGYVSAVWGASASLGPMLGAVLLAKFDWPSVFWMNLPLAAACILIVWRELPSDGPPAHPTAATQVGFGSSILLVLTLTPIMIAMAQYAALGPLRTGVTVTLGAIFGVLLVRSERLEPQPMMPAALWRLPIVNTASASAFLGGLVSMGVTAFLPTYLLGVTTRTPLVASLTLAILSVSWTTSYIGAGRLLHRLYYRSAAVTAAAVVVIGCVVLLAGTTARHAPALYLACAMLGAGLGTNSLLFTIGLQASVESEHRGRATAFFYFARLSGQAVGTAALGGVLNLVLLRGQASGDRAIDLVDTANRNLLSPAELALETERLAAGLQAVFLCVMLISIALLIIAGRAPKRTRIIGEA